VAGDLRVGRAVPHRRVEVDPQLVARVAEGRQHSQREQRPVTVADRAHGQRPTETIQQRTTQLRTDRRQRIHLLHQVRARQSGRLVPGDHLVCRARIGAAE
jgi:hypothetical protein